MQIRLSRKSDSEYIRSLYSQLHPDDPHTDTHLWNETYHRIITSEQNLLMVGTNEKKIICCCYLNIIPNLSRGLNPYGIIENVITDKHYRNHGFGKELIQGTLDLAREKGCYKVMLMTGSKKASVHHFYQSCGFQKDLKTAYIAFFKGSA